MGDQEAACFQKLKDGLASMLDKGMIDQFFHDQIMEYKDDGLHHISLIKGFQGATNAFLSKLSSWIPSDMDYEMALKITGNMASVAGSGGFSQFASHCMELKPACENRDYKKFSDTLCSLKEYYTKLTDDLKDILESIELVHKHCRNVMYEGPFKVYRMRPQMPQFIAKEEGKEEEEAAAEKEDAEEEEEDSEISRMVSQSLVISMIERSQSTWR